MPPDSHENFKRINVLVRHDQHERVTEAGLNMSGLVRGLLDDHFGKQRIVLTVSPEVKAVYQNVISNLGAEDRDLEPYFLAALDRYLEDKVREIGELRETIKKEE